MKRKIVLVTLGSKGDFLPFVGLAKVLKQRGFDPVVLSCEPYRTLAEREGVRFESFMSTEDFTKLDSPVLWKPMRGLNFYLKHVALATAPAIFEALARHAENGAVAVITNHMLAGSYIAAEKFSLPIVSIFLQPYSHLSSDNPAKVSPAVDRVVRWLGASGRRRLAGFTAHLMQSRLTPLNRMRVALGLQPWRNFFTETRYASDLVLGLWPDWFCPKKRDWPSVCQTAGFVDCSFAEKSGASPLAQDFLDQQPLIFAMGSEMTQNFESNVRIFQETCQAFGKKGIFVTPVIRGEGARKVDESLLLLEAAPFGEIFPQASCVITHGGIGTVAIALASGRPVVSVPMAYDQFDNAYQLERMQAGVTLSRDKMTVANLVGVIMNSFSRHQPMLAKRMKRERGAEAAVTLIERYLQSKQHYNEGGSHRLSI